jgi:heat shock protein HtpX
VFGSLVVFGLRQGQIRVRKGPGLLNPGTYPTTRALVREIAELIDAPMPSRLEVSADLNASAFTAGWRRRRVLSIGAPLWVALSPQARVALLAHELGHFAHGDVLRGRYVSSAAYSLVAWSEVFRLDGVARVAGWPVRVALAGYRRLLDVVAAPSHRRQELLADLSSVRAAGTDGAIDALEMVLAIVGLDVTANRVAIQPGRPPLGPALREYGESYDAAARAGARRRGDDQRSAIDDSHPPTTERLRLIESTEWVPAAVVLDDARAASLDREWASTTQRALDRLAERYRYRR